VIFKHPAYQNVEFITREIQFAMIPRTNVLASFGRANKTLCDFYSFTMNNNNTDL
jgi:hypothetical protein